MTQVIIILVVLDRLILRLFVSSLFVRPKMLGNKIVWGANANSYPAS